MKTLGMAWRNVLRNGRRTAVTVAAMSLALGVMISYSGLIDGYVAGMERNIVDIEMGDVQIFAEGYRDDPSLYATIPDAVGLVSRLEAAGLPASARLLAAGLAASGDQSAGVTLRGLDVRRDAGVSRVRDHVAKGEWLDPADPGGLVIGWRLARTLGAGIGGEVVILTQGSDGSMANDVYRVRGVLKSVGDAVDRTGIFMVESSFRDLLVLPEGAHQVIVRRPEGSDLAQAASIVRGIAPGLDSRTWRELVPTLASMLDSTRGVMFVMFMIVYMAIAIVILNAMLMAVFERIREFGVLKAIGVGPAGIFGLVMVESAVQAAVALVLGGALGWLGLLYLSRTGIDISWIGGISISGIAMDPVMRAVVTPQAFAGPAVTLVAIVTAAVIYPAVKAALVQPVTAMRER